MVRDASSVCVMDASGSLGSALVQRLLQRGYNVHAVLQQPNGDIMGIKEISNEEKEKLKMYYADPFDYKTIMDAMRGCCGLFYSFEPPQDHPTYDEFMTEMEVRAAHNVIEACAQTETIGKVVFTSSVTAVIWRNDRKSYVDEKHWSDANFCRKYKLWHGLSKSTAEKTAWALAMDRDINMVSINAGLLMNDLELSITNPYLKGAIEMYEDGLFVTVDLDFLVNAHIRAYEDVSSHGRYLCFNSIVNTPQDAQKLVSLLSPSIPKNSEQEMGVIPPRINNKKMNELMTNYDNLYERMIA